MNEQTALQFIAQIHAEQQDILIILDAKQYLEEILPDPKLMIISKEYIDDDGLHIAKVAHYGTAIYDETIRGAS